ncbi:MAG: hypothetical protein ACLRPX_09985 [Ruthenibacterium sp.]
MVEYIKREDAINLLWLYADESCASVVSDFESLPAADISEARHGRWLTTDAYPHHLYCSVCYKTYAKNAKWVNELDLPTNYCPNCGARMDKEANHEISKP